MGDRGLGYYTDTNVSVGAPQRSPYQATVTETVTDTKQDADTEKAGVCEVDATNNSVTEKADAHGKADMRAGETPKVKFVKPKDPSDWDKVHKGQSTEIVRDTAWCTLSMLACRSPFQERYCGPLIRYALGGS